MFEFDPQRINDLREFMLDEHELDRSQPRRYVSPRLTSAGSRLLDELVFEACQARNEIWLARAIQPHLLERVPASTSSGFRKVPTNASTTLADGIWNNLVCRSECRAARESGGLVEAYRAGMRREPRAESRALLGRRFEPSVMLDALRADAIDPHGRRSPVPVGPNSGLSIRAMTPTLVGEGEKNG